nr:hypothetical protein TetV2_00520 [Oceanusvirus sp.]
MLSLGALCLPFCVLPPRAMARGNTVQGVVNGKVATPARQDINEYPFLTCEVVEDSRPPKRCLVCLDSPSLYQDVAQAIEGTHHSVVPMTEYQAHTLSVGLRMPIVLLTAKEEEAFFGYYDGVEPYT